MQIPTGAPPHGSEAVLLAGPPPAQGGSALLLVHGRGAAPRSIVETARAHGSVVDAFSLVAPAAEGNTWYPRSFLAPTSENQPKLDSALGRLAQCVAALEGEGIPRARVVLMGFSQGACLAAEFVARNPARYGGVVVYSGGLIGPPGTSWETGGGGLRDTPVFLGCSDVDHHVPLERVEESARVFQALGARVEKRISPGMGHLVNEDEMAWTTSLLEEILEEEP